MMWAIFGTLYLIWMTVQDFRNGMRVDDRKNWFMMGMSLSLLALFPQPWYYVLGLAAVVLLLRFVLKGMIVVGEGDANALVWIMYGFGIVNLWALVFFCGVLVLFTVFYHLVKHFVFKSSERWPFFFVLLVDFVLVCFLYDFFFI